VIDDIADEGIVLGILSIASEAENLSMIDHKRAAKR